MAIRKVALLYPAARRYSGYLSAQRMPGLVCTHAGLTILAQMLHREGIAARVYDEQITPFSPAMLEGVDLVGISAMTPGAPQAYALAGEARRRGIPVVLGGAHATLDPDDAVLHADFVVRGEGEFTLVELARALSEGRDFDDIAGLSYWQRGKARHNAPRRPMTTEELDRVPFPRLELVEGFDNPLRFPLNRSLYFTMLTRGCSQRCAYCSITGVFGHSLRHRSVANIIGELGSRWDPNRQFLFLMDDSLGVDRGFLKELLTRLVERKLVPRLGWHSQMRVDVAEDEELLGLLKATRCLFLSCGFESPSDRSLAALGKGQKVSDVVRLAGRLRAQGILLNGFFMLGTDEEGPEALGETVRYARSLGCTLAGFMPLTPYPGTPMWRKLDRQGRIFTRDWELYDQQHVVFHPARTSAWRLYWNALLCYPAFYGGQNPWRQARTILPRWPLPLLAAVGVVWPVMRHAVWLKEVAANADYLRALWRESRRPGRIPFPDLSRAGLWHKDLFSGRTVRRVLGGRR